jgi:hypothetical protein
MAHQRDFEAAAKRGAVQGRDHRLRASFQRVLDFRKCGALRWLAELGNIGPGDKGAAGADQHDRLDGRIGCRLPGAVAKAVADVGRERIDRR